MYKRSGKTSLNNITKIFRPLEVQQKHKENIDFKSKYKRVYKTSIKTKEIKNDIISKLHTPECITEEEVSKNTDIYANECCLYDEDLREDVNDDYEMNTDNNEDVETCVNSIESQLSLEEEIRLYENSEIYLYEACLLLTAFDQRFNLSNEGKAALLTTIKTILPKSNKLPKTFNGVQKIAYENKNKNEIKVQEYCQFCKCRLEDEDSCSTCIISNSLKKNDVFYSTSLIPQLKQLIELYHNEIMAVVNDKRRDFVDLIDSNYYKAKSESSLKLLIYTDGLWVVKSPAKSVWPVICSLCELPSRLRDSKRNKITVGVWYGFGKPSNDILFSELVKDLNILKTSGLECVFGGSKKIIFIEPYGLLCDTPAKATVMNMIQFNGYYGCPYCLDPGEHQNQKHLFLLANNNIPLRKHQDYLKYAASATESKPIFCLKGNAILTDVLEFPTSIPLDYMHLIFEGIFNTLLTYWLNSSNKEQDYYITPINQRKIQEIISRTKLPHTITRRYFVLNKYKSWKASEIRTFMFYLALPVLKHFLKEKYFWNLSYFIHAIRILHTFSDDKEIEKARYMLDKFSESYVRLYGRSSQTYTFHAIAKHLVNDARLHGSLSQHSMFSLESTLGCFKKYIKGTRGIPNQFLKGALNNINFNYLWYNYEKSPFKNEDISSLINRWMKNSNKTYPGSTLLKPFAKQKLNHFMSNLLAEFNIPHDNYLEVYYRVCLNYQVFHSKRYRYSNTSCSYLIHYEHEGETKFAYIEYFFVVQHQTYALLNLLHAMNKDFFFNFIDSVNDNNKIDEAYLDFYHNFYNLFYAVVKETQHDSIIKVEKIKGKCVLCNIYLEMQQQNEKNEIFYITPYINEYEHD